MKKPKYSKDEVSQTFNLKELLGYKPSGIQKELFAELVIDKIVDRTISGKDIDGKKFQKYSKEYAKFKGVSRDSVDMIFDGDMLNSIEYEAVSTNQVKVKVGEGVDTLKAFNHNISDTLPTRTFFGFKDEKQIKDIIEQVDLVREIEKEERQDNPRISAADLRQAVFETIDIDFEGFDG
jgi:hypothetical protein